MKRFSGLNQTAMQFVFVSLYVYLFLCFSPVRILDLLCNKVQLIPEKIKCLNEYSGSQRLNFSCKVAKRSIKLNGFYLIFVLLKKINCIFWKLYTPNQASN